MAGHKLAIDNGPRAPWLEVFELFRASGRVSVPTGLGRARSPPVCKIRFPPKCCTALHASVWLLFGCVYQLWVVWPCLCLSPVTARVACVCELIAWSALCCLLSIRRGQAALCSHDMASLTAVTCSHCHRGPWQHILCHSLPTSPGGDHCMPSGPLLAAEHSSGGAETVSGRDDCRGPN